MFRDQPQQDEGTSQISAHDSEGIHYFLDVDDTLMIYNEELVFNEGLISKLKALGVKRLTLLTRTDAKKYSATSPIRIPLINYLRDQGFIVDRVLTPTDMLYRDAGHDNFHPGDAYEKYMRPVEVALMPVREIPEKIFIAYKNFYSSVMILDALNYLRDHQLIAGEEKIPELINLIQNRAAAIEEHIYANYSTEESADYCMIFEGLFNYINFHQEKVDTLNDLIEKITEGVKNEKQQLPSVDNYFQTIAAYYAELTKYRNLQFQAHLTINKNKVTKGSEKEDPAASSNPAHTKGAVYAWYLAENPLRPDAKVVFIDDNTKEHVSLQRAHSASGFEHDLQVSLPPRFKGFATGITIPEEEFNQFLVGCHWHQDLKKYLNNEPISDTFHQLYIRYLVEKGREEVSNKNYNAAIYYFQFAYLFCNDPAQTQEQQSQNEEIAQHRVLAKKAYYANKDDQPYFDISHLDNLWVNLKRQCGFNAQLKMVSVAIAEHKINNPSLYHSSFFNFGFLKSAIDKDFKSKILGEVFYMANAYPDRKSECLAFLEKLNDALTCSVYKKHLQEIIMQINDISQPKNEDGYKPAGQTV